MSLKLFSISLFMACLCFPLEAKVTLSVSQTMASFVNATPTLSKHSKILLENDEASVKEAFLSHKSKLAIVREDFLLDFQNNKQALKKAPYHIIGQVSQKAILYFASQQPEAKTLKKIFAKQRVSLGTLGEGTGKYIKPLLQKKGLLYQSTLRALDPYHSVDALRKKKIDAFFLFAPESYEKLFAKYLLDYPVGLKEHLETYKSLTCADTKKYCSSAYYLIASDTLGKEVMENMYVHTKSLLAKKRQLVSHLGKYYIYTGLKKRNTHKDAEAKKHNQKEKEKIHFGRTPWMDTAIHEAIKGKGSSEHVLPMLSLSYKYIRFAKGNAGITTAPNDNKEGSWCAAYICWTLNKSGYKVHSSGRMASQSFRYFNNKVYRKIDKPIFGAITLYTNMKKQTHGHVGYLFGKTKKGKYILLGGNQSNRLKFANYAERFGSYKLKGFYVPLNYKIKAVDYLTKKDIYTSAKMLNKKYGIQTGKHKNTVR